MESKAAINDLYLEPTNEYETWLETIYWDNFEGNFPTALRVFFLRAIGTSRSSYEEDVPSCEAEGCEAESCGSACPWAS